MMPVMALDCTAEPMPNEATAANSANAPAPKRPHHGALPSFSNARRHAYIAPPSMLPLWSFTRYFTAANVSEYFVAMPNTPVSHIHSTAPGPPARMAVPTPTMLPVPMVADSAVVSAPNWLMSPGASGSFVTDSLIAVGSLRWMNRCETSGTGAIPAKARSSADPTRSVDVADELDDIHAHPLSSLVQRIPLREKEPAPKQIPDAPAHDEAVSAEVLSHAKVVGL